MKFTAATDTDTRIRQSFFVVDAQPLLVSGRVIDLHQVTVDARFRQGIPSEWVVELRGRFRDNEQPTLQTVTFCPEDHRAPEVAIQVMVPIQAQPMFDAIAATAAQLHAASKGVAA